jgi:hypothetical protein
VYKRQLQSNAVIWVEGPSDRIYIQRWISIVDPSLIEGIHFSIMFYGGGLLRHLTPDDPNTRALTPEHQAEAIDEFISLRRLNRNLAIVIDSDKTKAHSPLNSTKVRVRQAFDDSDGPGHAWITDGYTIENYVPRDLLEAAFEATHPRMQLDADGGKWSNPLKLSSGSHPDKVAIARNATQHWPQDGLKGTRLSVPVRKLVDLIRIANGLDPLDSA